MKYMIMVYGNRQLWESFSPEEFTNIVAAHDAFNREVHESGEYVSGAGLAFEEEARTVRVQDGETIVTDGPFLEAKEYLASYTVIDVETLDRAVELAAKLPSASLKGIIVWPLMDDSGQEM